MITERELQFYFGASPDIELTTSRPSQMLKANIISTHNLTLYKISVDVITSSDTDSEIGTLIERGGSASGDTIGEIAIAGGVNNGASNEVTFMGATSIGGKEFEINSICFESRQGEMVMPEWPKVTTLYDPIARFYIGSGIISITRGCGNNI